MQGPDTNTCGRTARCARLALQSLEHRGGEGVVVLAQLRDLAVLHEHGVALRAHAAQLARRVELHVEGLGELALGVRKHAHLALSLLGLPPRGHHEGVVHRDAGDNLGPRSLELLGACDVAWKVLLGACGCECPRHREEDALLALEELQDVHGLPGLALVHLDRGQGVALCGLARDHSYPAARDARGHAPEAPSEGGRRCGPEQAPGCGEGPNEQQYRGGSTGATAGHHGWAVGGGRKRDGLEPRWP
mmetsp:Transcript_39005/g.123995  ORF Transcript_39005/g.123995 Transcript_39005/m.123995 type:complete len:247 (-) Transcript_39005:2-742(-)